jgi:predicted aldo/keto reductase-like oxidoreductase
MRKTLENTPPSIRIHCIDADVPWIALGTAELEMEQKPNALTLNQVINSAIQKGIRVIDTASNYYEGQAEHFIGKALADRAKNNHKDKIYVFTKVGQLTNSEMNENTACSREIQGEHWCFDADYIEMSIKRSISRLCVSQLDGVYLHNPEDSVNSESPMDIIKRLAPLFESLCAKGLIKYWGVASWSGFYRYADDPGSIQLAEIDRFFSSNYKTHHFKLIQSPMGLWNLDTFLTKFQITFDKEITSMTLLESVNTFDLDLCLSSPFYGGHYIPTKVDSILSPAQKNLLESRINAPLALRVIGMRSDKSLTEALALFKV